MSIEVQEENAETPVETEMVKRAVPVTPYYSYILIACIIAVSIVQIMTDPPGSAILGGNRSAIIAGFDKQAFLYFGEYWRILTGATLHGGVVHLAFNGYALFALGRLVETLSNRAHLAIMFLLSAIGGGLMTLVLAPNAPPSIGASGGIIGFLGYLTVYGFYRRKLLSNALLKNMLFNIGFIAFIGVFVIPNVDNFGHLGGLLTGAIYGAFQIPRDLFKDPREVTSLTEILGMAAVGIFAFFSVLSISLLLGWVHL